MMYNDKECCNDDHRDNILHKNHIHVSIGITYDKYYFAFVENFENQYVGWTQPVSYDGSSNEVNMSGKMADNMKAEMIQIYYDPLPTKEVYLQNRDKDSYDNGEVIAAVLPRGWELQDSSTMVVHVSKWDIHDQNFDISFSLKEAVAKQGKGVYTVVLWAERDNGDKISVANIANFVGVSS